MRKSIDEHIFAGERALFYEQELFIKNSIFEHGESPLKESRDIEVEQSIFKWKYPLWYSKTANIHDSVILDSARAGIWYTDQVRISHTTIEAPKTFRRSTDITLDHVDMPNASETFWMCDGVSLSDVSAKGDYFAMNASNIKAKNLRLTGNYSFDGCKDVEITGAKLLSKDAFWNCENVVVSDTFITGEYIGWNSRNLTFVNCTIESLQGFCYIDGLTLKNCRLLKTNLAFEYCKNISADITTTIDSIKNPISGVINAEGIGEIIFDDPQIDPKNTCITFGRCETCRMPLTR
ncbi:Protein of unknown function [Paenibacillus sophorae]|uniref:DUF3737 family protein n=1 Tax=Paenibacillus sophorae TaxID=1333845 RepID=A0A1H8U0C0_9BACL|nr:DUF3737 family protein [Paenibacillus sophorae]QWU13116.1 DUF3737 family protein [Paenibacillus sophorae]SEO96263.1 Protein of unknown function [Paenibacillus sophorae]